MLASSDRHQQLPAIASKSIACTQRMAGHSAELDFAQSGPEVAHAGAEENTHFAILQEFYKIEV